MSGSPERSSCSWIWCAPSAARIFCCELVNVRYLERGLGLTWMPSARAWLGKSPFSQLETCDIRQREINASQILTLPGALLLAVAP